jgi:hypothetical protein
MKLHEYITDTDKLNEVMKQWQIFKMQQKNQPHPYAKSYKVITKKRKGRKTEVRHTELGIPYEVVTNEGDWHPHFNTNNYTKLIVLFFEAFYGYESRRISSEGRYRPDGKGGGKFIRGLNTGIEDVQVYCSGGRMLAVEVKSPTDRMSEKQMERKKLLGEWYIVATADVPTFIKQVTKLLGEPENKFQNKLGLY